jgi:hypothetical protein
MEPQNSTRNWKGTLWQVLFVAVNNAIWITYFYEVTIHGNESWYRWLDNFSQILFVFGGIVLLYGFLIRLEALVKKIYHLARVVLV